MLTKLDKFYYNMSTKGTKRRKHNLQTSTGDEISPTFQLPDSCKESVRNHINSVYVGSIVHIHDPVYGAEGHLVTTHWRTKDGIFATLHEDCKMGFVSLKYKT